MLFRPRLRQIGCFALPYLWVFELFCAGRPRSWESQRLFSQHAWVCSAGNFSCSSSWFGFAFCDSDFHRLPSAGRDHYKRYNDWKDVVRLVSYCFFEHFPYRQMHMIWRLQGLWQYLRGDRVWNPVKRKGLQSAQAPWKQANRSCVRLRLKLLRETCVAVTGAD